METRYLRSVLKIADTGSITRAADSLGLSQPSLSNQLLRIEDEVGVQLFSRTARGVTLTDAGKRFVLHVGQILEAVNNAVEDSRKFGQAAVGDVILAVPYSLSRMAGAAIFKAMAERAPKVRFRLVEAMTAQTWGWIEEAKVD
ncbi:MAG: LysR family transcriptional regulator, partial [Novosphingobium sp.]|nr:LysR family transcriptional regulator [Novosphingobium sp.]